MILEIKKSIERLEGVKEISKEIEETNKTSPGFGDVVSFVFSYKSVIFEFTQISSPQFTVNKLEAAFSFPTSKKQDRSKLLGVINSFNKSRVAIKAVLGNIEKDSFRIVFSSEFMCPDQSIVDGITHPTIRILRLSGSMLVDMLGGHGIAMKDPRKNE